jgi:hypothetical protein
MLKGAFGTNFRAYEKFEFHGNTYALHIMPSNYQSHLWILECLISLSFGIPTIGQVYDQRNIEKH